MFDLSALKTAKSQVQEKKVENTVEYDKVYSEAIQLFEQFDETLSAELLKQAGKKFVEALSFRKDKAEPYFFLAYIYFLFAEDDLALEYYEFAKNLDSSLKGLAELEMLILGNIRN
jgi:Tfp pilus assembly protein PilF